MAGVSGEAVGDVAATEDGFRPQFQAWLLDQADCILDLTLGRYGVLCPAGRPEAAFLEVARAGVEATLLTVVAQVQEELRLLGGASVECAGTLHLLTAELLRREQDNAALSATVARLEQELWMTRITLDTAEGRLEHRDLHLQKERAGYLREISTLKSALWRQHHLREEDGLPVGWQMGPGGAAGVAPEDEARLEALLEGLRRKYRAGPAPSALKEKTNAGAAGPTPGAAEPPPPAVPATASQSLTSAPLGPAQAPDPEPRPPTPEVLVVLGDPSAPEPPTAVVVRRPSGEADTDSVDAPSSPMASTLGLSMSVPDHWPMEESTRVRPLHPPPPPLNLAALADFERRSRASGAAGPAGRRGSAFPPRSPSNAGSLFWDDRADKTARSAVPTIAHSTSRGSVWNLPSHRSTLSRDEPSGGAGHAGGEAAETGSAAHRRRLGSQGPGETPDSLVKSYERVIQTQRDLVETRDMYLRKLQEEHHGILTLVETALREVEVSGLVPPELLPEAPKAEDDKRSAFGAAVAPRVDLNPLRLQLIRLARAVRHLIHPKATARPVLALTEAEDDDRPEAAEPSDLPSDPSRRRRRSRHTTSPRPQHHLSVGIRTSPGRPRQRRRCGAPETPDRPVSTRDAATSPMAKGRSVRFLSTPLDMARPETRDAGTQYDSIALSLVRRRSPAAEDRTQRPANPASHEGHTPLPGHPAPHSSGDPPGLTDTLRNPSASAIPHASTPGLPAPDSRTVPTLPAPNGIPSRPADPTGPPATHSGHPGPEAGSHPNPAAHTTGAPSPARHSGHPIDPSHGQRVDPSPGPAAASSPPPSSAVALQGVPGPSDQPGLVARLQAEPTIGPPPLGIAESNEMERKRSLEMDTPPSKRLKSTETSEELRILMPPPSPLPRRPVASPVLMRTPDAAVVSAFVTGTAQIEDVPPRPDAYLGALSIPDTPLDDGASDALDAGQDLFSAPPSFVPETQLTLSVDEALSDSQSLSNQNDAECETFCAARVDADLVNVSSDSTVALAAYSSTPSLASAAMMESAQAGGSRPPEGWRSGCEGGAQPLSLCSDGGSVSSGGSLTPALLPEVLWEAPPVDLPVAAAGAVSPAPVPTGEEAQHMQNFGAEGPLETLAFPPPPPEVEPPAAPHGDVPLTADSPAAIPSPSLTLPAVSPVVATAVVAVAALAAAVIVSEVEGGRQGEPRAREMSPKGIDFAAANAPNLDFVYVPTGEPACATSPVQAVDDIPPTTEDGDEMRQVEASTDLTAFSQDLLEDRHAPSSLPQAGVADGLLPGSSGQAGIETRVSPDVLGSILTGPEPGPPPPSASSGNAAGSAGPWTFYGATPESLDNAGQQPAQTAIHPQPHHVAFPTSPSSSCHDAQPPALHQLWSKQGDGGKPMMEFTWDGRRSTGRLSFGVATNSPRAPSSGPAPRPLPERPAPRPSGGLAGGAPAPGDDIQDFPDPPAPPAPELAATRCVSFAGPAPRSPAMGPVAALSARQSTPSLEPPGQMAATRMSLYPASPFHPTPPVPATASLLAPLASHMSSHFPAPASLHPGQQTAPPIAQAECSSTLGARAPVPGPFPYINREHPIVLQGSVALPSPGPVLRAAWASGADGILGVCTPHALLLVCCVGERWQCCRQFLASIVHGEELYDFCFDVRAQTICLCGRLLDARFGAGQNATGSLVIGCLIFSLDRATGESVLDSSIVASAVLPHTDRVHAVLRDADHSLFTAGQDGLLVKAAMAANWKSVKDTTTLQAVPVGTPGIAFSDGRAPVLSLALPETHFATILLGICSTHCGRQIAVWNRSTHQLLATLPCDGHRILGVVPDQAYRQQTPNDFSHLLVLLLEGEAGQQMCTLNTISPTGLQRNHIYQCKQQELGPRLCMDVTFSQKSQSSKYLALGTATGRVALHNLSTGNCVGILCDLAGTAVDAVAFHGQQSLFATCGRSGAVNVYGQPDGAAHSVT